MTNISKHKLPKQAYDDLYQEFTNTLAKLNKHSAHHFFSELLTYSERVMLVKRLSAVLMFDRNYSAYQVWTSLHISPTTAQKLYSQYESGEFDKLLSALSENNKMTLFGFIELLTMAQVNTKARAKLIKFGLEN